MIDWLIDQSMMRFPWLKTQCKTQSGAEVEWLENIYDTWRWCFDFDWFSLLKKKHTNYKVNICLMCMLLNINFIININSILAAVLWHWMCMTTMTNFQDNSICVKLCTFYRENVQGFLVMVDFLLPNNILNPDQNTNAKSQKRNLPVPVQSFVIVSIKEMWFSPKSSNIWMNPDELQHRPGASFLNANYKCIGQLLIPIFRRITVITLLVI